MSDLPATSTITLADGRALGYREYGAPSGMPLIHAHGGLACGLDAAWADAAARDLDVRVIAPDRPGLLGSDPQMDRVTVDWAGDVAQLADALGIERFYVAGWSMGGQYALACAASLDARVIATAVLAGAPPLDDATTFGELNRLDHQLTLLAQHHPAVARVKFEALAEVAKHSPHVFDRIVLHGMTDASRAAAASLPAPGIAAAFAPALRSAEGMVEEYRAWARPWGFRPEDIASSIQIWWGEVDPLIPRAWAASLAERIPNAKLHTIPAADHMLPLTRYGSIIEALLTAK